MFDHTSMIPELWHNTWRKEMRHITGYLTLDKETYLQPWLKALEF